MAESVTVDGVASIAIHTFQNDPLRSEAKAENGGSRMAAILELPPMASKCYYHIYHTIGGTITPDIERPSGLIIILCDWKKNRMHHQCSIIVSRHALLKYTGELRGNGRPDVVPWLEWGPNATRMFCKSDGYW